MQPGNRRVSGSLVLACCLTLAACLLLSAGPVTALDVPNLSGYVNDYANMISPDMKATLMEGLRTYEQTDSTQVVILTVPSLEGDAIEDFSIRVAEAWKIGQKGKDNGVIVVVSKEDRKIRIEVGRGLEGKLTDLAAGRIIDLVIKPRFKQGDFDGGFREGVVALIKATRGEFTAEPGRQGTDRRSGGGNFSRFITFLIFTVIGLGIAGSISKTVGGISGAVGIPALVHTTLMPLGLVGLVIAGLLGGLAGLLIPALFSSSGRGFHPGGGYYGGGGGFYGGGGFSSGGDSGGSDFGGGGGGDFGGGGASGDW